MYLDNAYIPYQSANFNSGSSPIIQKTLFQRRKKKLARRPLNANLKFNLVRKKIG